MTEAFDGDWLALREGFDAAARSLALGQALSAALPDDPRLLDMGAGTGSLLRWLAPLIGRDQRWTLVDADPVLLGRAMRDIAGWADARGMEVTGTSGTLSLASSPGRWQVVARTADLADGAPDLAGQDAVVCSALLDLVSAAWIRRFAAGLRIPLLACLSVDGRDGMVPPLPLDLAVGTAFRRDQRRDKGFGRALGPTAPAVLQDTLQRHGFTVRSARSDWHIPRVATAMLLKLTGSFADVALSAPTACKAAVEGWERTRRRQIAARRLAIRVGHRDILALPG